MEIAWAFNPIGKIALLPNLMLPPTVDSRDILGIEDY
jgi:hypothetical protein